MNELVKLELTPADAALFLKFREHQEKFNILLSNGLFNVRNGCAVLNFDGAGTLTQVDFNIVMYKKGFPQILHITGL